MTLWKSRKPCSPVHGSVWKKGRENKTDPSAVVNLSCYRVAQEGKYSAQDLRPLGTLGSGTQAGAGTCPSAPAPLPATAPCASARAALGKGAPSRRDWGTLGSFLLQEPARAAPAPSTTQALCFGDEESHGAFHERVWGSRAAILGAPPGQEAGSHRGLPGTSTPLPGHELPQHELNPRHCCS